jgi:transcriptional regulator with XRE-family HTH domain
MKFREYKQQALKNPKFSEEYNKYNLEFEVAKMLIKARQLKNKTQSGLAKLVGTTQPTVARLEKGDGLPSLSLLQRIAEAYNTILLVNFAFMEDRATQTLHAKPIKTREAFEPILFSLNFPKVQSSDLTI